ncbi:hypothetical protein HYV49_02480 [Candidatus Pacearchaeota archaeon]|nr:hypothetical protein [Candidatus Pacearchaeota archaeon]
MAKRSHRLEKGIESLKKEIEEHFLKIELDIKENKIDRGRYHIKEIDKSLINALEKKMNLLEEDVENIKLIKIYKNRLEEYKKKLGIV